MQLKLLDSLVEPIIHSEVWGFENIQIIEKIHLKVCKIILNVRLTTPDYMVNGELGRYPLEIGVNLRMVSFWTKLVQCKNKLSSILYRLMLHIHQSGNHDFKWIFFVMSIFDNTGLSYIFVNQLNINIHSLKPVLKERLHDTLSNNGSQMLKTHLMVNFTRSSNLNLDLRNTYQNYQSKIGFIYQNLDVQI